MTIANKINQTEIENSFIGFSGTKKLVISVLLFIMVLLLLNIVIDAEKTLEMKTKWKLIRLPEMKLSNEANQFPSIRSKSINKFFVTSWNRFHCYRHPYKIPEIIFSIASTYSTGVLYVKLCCCRSACALVLLLMFIRRSLCLVVHWTTSCASQFGFPDTKKPNKSGIGKATIYTMCGTQKSGLMNNILL